MKKALVAGATGYLGQFLVNELKKRNYWVRVLIRKKDQKKLFDCVDDYFVGEITQAKSIEGIAEGIDEVYTCIGITRQKDGLTYMDVDFQGNLNLLNESKRAAVNSFLYVSALNGDKLRHLKIFEAKEKFVDMVKSSGLNYTIVRPNGFFSDMEDFLRMARRGKVYLFGNGTFKLNPIHGADLAKVCVDAIYGPKNEINVGGPDILTQNDLATLAFKAWSKKPKILHLPDWIRKMLIWTLRKFTSVKTYGPIEFFLTTMAMDFIAPQFGTHRLKYYFNNKVKEIKVNE